MSKRIMVIDDDESIRELFNFILTDEGWEVVSNVYSQSDLQKVQQLQPDLILLDFNPVQAGVGWSFLQLLKMDDVTAVIPIVICTTALSLTLEIESYLATRHICIVRKPFNIDDLLLTIQKSFLPDPVLPILVVDDNEDLFETVTTILWLSGYLAETAPNGRLALDAVVRTQYSLILLDIEMPVMNGLEFLAAYARHPGPHAPVIILSARPDLAPDALPEFVMAVLPKPFELKDLVALVAKYAQPVWGGVEPS